MVNRFVGRLQSLGLSSELFISGVYFIAFIQTRLLIINETITIDVELELEQSMLGCWRVLS